MRILIPEYGHGAWHYKGKLILTYDCVGEFGEDAEIAKGLGLLGWLLKRWLWIEGFRPKKEKHS